MDTNRFDHLARSLIAPSRRRFSRALAGLGLAGGLSVVWGGLDTAAKRKKKKKCKGEKKKCGKKCIPKANCCTDEDCDVAGGFTCESGKCICGSRGVSAQLC